MFYYIRSVCHASRNARTRIWAPSRSIFHLLRGKAGQKAEKFNSKDYKLIYYFPAIKVFAYANKTKFMRFLVPVFVCGTSYVSYKSDKISHAFFFGTILFAINFTILTHLVVRLGKNLVGIIYINKPRTHVMIAFVDESGKRVNKEFEINKLVLSDHPNSILNRYCKQISSTNENVKYNIHLEKKIVIDQLLFSKVFPNYG